MLLSEFYFSLVFTHFYGIAQKYVRLSRSLAFSVVSRESVKKRLNKQAKTLDFAGGHSLGRFIPGEMFWKKVISC